MKTARKGPAPGVDICTYTGKRRFRSKAGAYVAAARLLKSKKWKSNTARAYACMHCGGWHLTSQGIYCG